MLVYLLVHEGENFPMTLRAVLVSLMGLDERRLISGHPPACLPVYLPLPVQAGLG